MLRIADRFDRRLLVGVVILIASAALLAAGLFSVLSALTDDPVDLPSEGSLDDILADSISSDDPSALPDNDNRPPAIPPVGITIPRLHIDAPVVAMGTDANRIPQVPASAEEVAWYTFSSAPGRGNAVLSGHVDWQTLQGQPIPGVFYRLRELEIGDTIEVALQNGETITYRVTGNVAAEFNDQGVIEAMGPTSNDVVTLITCGGSWFNDPSRAFGGNYSHRIVVRAERIQDAAAAGSQPAAN